jgi:hemerythrin-like metal-binding protein
MGRADEVMIEFAWTGDMSVGVPALDSDHRCLIRIINTLKDVDHQHADRVVDTALNSLIAYCRYHFAREEQVMRGCGFPALDFHRGEHEGFARFVSGLRQRYANRTESAMIEELRDYLTRWLRHHILIQDMAFKPYVLAAMDADVLASDADVLPSPLSSPKERPEVALSWHGETAPCLD